MFILVIVATLTTPLFVTLGEGVLLGKIIPSVLSLIAAGSTAWLQLRKPQSLWSLYRDCQRKIEKHVTKYNYRLDEYDCDDEERKKLLAKVICDVAWDAHEKWLPLIPTPEAMGAIPGKRVLLDHERAERTQDS